MVSFIAVLAAAVMALLLELPGMRAKGYKREIVVFIAFLAVGTTLYAAMALHVKFPNPLMLIKWIYG